MIKNWRPLPLLNTDVKTLKGSLIKIKGSSLKFNSSQQTAYMKNRQFGEGGRLIWNIIQIAKLNYLGFLVVMDTENKFEPFDHASYFCPKKYGFGQNFVLWTNTLYSYVKGQEVFEHYSFSAYADDTNVLWKTCNQLEI